MIQSSYVGQLFLVSEADQLEYNQRKADPDCKNAVLDLESDAHILTVGQLLKFDHENFWFIVFCLPIGWERNWLSKTFNCL